MLTVPLLGRYLDLPVNQKKYCYLKLCKKKTA